MELQWDGSAFWGWQAQRGLRTVQDTLLAASLPLAAQVKRPVAAGRTDAGVHARCMTCHLDGSSWRLEATRIAAALNARLPPDLQVLAVRLAPPGFHARYSCLSRRYCYRLLVGPQALPLERGRCHWVKGPLDLPAMRRAAQILVGQHNFSAWATAETRNPERRLYQVEIRSEPLAGGELVEIQLEGESFLRQMVRGLAGTLLQVGYGRRDPEELPALLRGQPRSRGDPNLPAQGLYFEGALYPGEGSAGLTDLD